MTIRCSGRWIYDNSIEQSVDIVAFDFDWWHELAIADAEADDEEDRQPLGPDNCLYYVRFRHAGETTKQTWVDSPGFSTLEEAKQHAENQVPSSIRWLSKYRRR